MSYDTAPSYTVLGSSVHKLFGVFNAMVSIATAYGDTVQPEIQSTLRSPSIPKMTKGVYCAAAFIFTVFFTTAITGYWAFGNAVSVVILASLTPYVSKAMVLFGWTFAGINNGGTTLVYQQPTFEW